MWPAPGLGVAAAEVGAEMGYRPPLSSGAAPACGTGKAAACPRGRPWS